MGRKEFLIIAIATLITVLAWVIFDILHARAKVTIPPKTQELIEPLNPNFDLEGI
ncbi:hypothetical protein HY386_01135 [Candidatus Daviesbacteria bacterium]|nr:hypothetical protein [Candidatus Daviesbacteria bacterium]